MQEVKGVVARAKGAPVTLETILVPDPGPGEAAGDLDAPALQPLGHYRGGAVLLEGQLGRGVQGLIE